MSQRSFRPLDWLEAVVRAGSIRKAAEVLHINSTALNRRILALEEELGVLIFERLPRGVRLSTAGELLVEHIRTQRADFERLRSQIADLSGERRGHVSLASTRAALPFFLPEQISAYRREHPLVTFAVRQRSRQEAEEALADFSADIALVFEPVRRADFHTIVSAPQRVHAILPRAHRLAAQSELRLRDCLAEPFAIPPASAGVRQLLELASARTGRPLTPAVESEDAQFLINHAEAEGLIAFDIPLGLSEQRLALQGLTMRPIDRRDAPEGRLYLGQLRGRTLPVAAARFADQLARALEERYSPYET